MMPTMSRRVALGALTGSLAMLRIPAARADDKLRVGKAVAENFGYVPLDVGMEFGHFAKQGLTIEKLDFIGGSKVAQALTAGAVDISLSGGPDMAFIAKGAPELAVGSITSSPAFMALAVGTQSPVQSTDDLKGKKIGIASPGSVTAWLADELNRLKGWTSERDRVTPVVIGGSTTAAIAALKTNQTDAIVTALQAAYLLEAQHEGRLLVNCAEYVKTIELFTTFASTAIIQQNPDAVQRFLKGWYEAVDFMKSHKAETVRLATVVMGYPADVTERTYDFLMPKFSSSGKFEPEALDKLRDSFDDLKSLSGPVEMGKLYTEKFLPPTAG